MIESQPGVDVFWLEGLLLVETDVGNRHLADAQTEPRIKTRNLWSGIRRSWDQKPNSLTYNFIIFRFLRLEVSVWISSKEGAVFYQVFLLTPLQCAVMHCRNHKRLRQFEEI